MRYVLVLLLGSIAWTAPAFAQVPDETGKAEKVHVQEIGKGGAFAPFPSALDQLQAPDPLGRKVHVQEIDKGGAFAPAPSTSTIWQSYGETQAEFEARERRCLATAIYFLACDRPVRGRLRLPK